MRLRRWDPAGPALRRRRRGRGFSYEDVDGRRLIDDETLRRIRALAIPPAWRDVRICPWPNGHLQAVGTDDAGRRQYLYHPQWRARKDREKFARILEFGWRLPDARKQIAEDLRSRGLNRRRVLGAAARLLDLGFFRVGGEQYAEENGSYGLATLLARHVEVRRGHTLVFDYPAKSGQERVQSVADEQVVAVIRALLRRRDPDDTLLAYYQDRGWHNVNSADINGYLHELFGDDISAKDFRTWHGTVLAAAALAVAERTDTPTARKRARTQAMREVGACLGNTPAVCRSSYVDPAVVDAFERGQTIKAAVAGVDTDEIGGLAMNPSIERAVLELLTGDE
ncbi:DNA topoisomerase IB [Phytoactinopolyspora halotolerans]|uniref:DNA topoisomerase n=1 Tax=Phytoactinopolyspora halotolerans TaxID=1981512 RepID=A0A6L9SCB4_9ACTN|nr:DNA topoisomerase IB [Phytoactinopolyspora halotolerans]NEE02649.1 DNA topoisomerase IB [Phytoactinopolyspora halotolerans]